MFFNVTRIIDGDTFVVSPNWEWNGYKGNRVRPIGWDAPEIGTPGYYEATCKLESLILLKNVELKNVIKLSYDRLLCTVYLNGVNIADYFKQYSY